MVEYFRNEYKEIYKNTKTQQWHFLNHGFYIEADIMNDDPYKYQKFLYFKAVENINPNYSLLDVGCGAGGGMKFLKEIGFHNVSGFDLSDDAIDKAVGIGCNAYVGDAEIEESYKDNYLAIISVESCHSYSDLNRFIDIAMSHLHKQGKMMILDVNLSIDHPRLASVEDITEQVGLGCSESVKYMNRLLPESPEKEFMVSTLSRMSDMYRDKELTYSKAILV